VQTSHAQQTAGEFSVHIVQTTIKLFQFHDNSGSGEGTLQGAGNQRYQITKKMRKALIKTLTEIYRDAQGADVYEYRLVILLAGGIEKRQQASIKAAKAKRAINSQLP
jgi:hypothetical protein